MTCRAAAIGSLMLGLLACSSSNGPGGGSGGDSGGSRAGATAASGGVSGAGGQPSASGGAPSTASGGAPSTGGSRGGTSGQGGSSAGSGGSTSETSAGGTTTASASGGAASGGRSGSGGVSATGGTGTGGALVNSGGSTSAAGGSGKGGGGAGGDASGGSSGAVSCPAGASKPTEGKKTITVGSTSRSYYLHVPSKYDPTKPTPLVVDFHGLGGSGSSEAGSNPYKPVVDPDGVLSAYPDGVNGTNGTGWNLGPCCTTVDDVAFAKALVQDVEKVACVDTKRVYAVGFSLGGGMTHVIGCKAADVFAAISPAAADLVKETLDSCKPARPLTVITFRGTADTAVPYGGGSMGSFTNIGAKATFQKWAELDQCTGSPSAEDSNGCSTYSACANGVQVTLCTKQGGGHEPGNATVSWPILKKYSM